MPRNSSGVYTLPLPPVVPGTTITSTWANTTLDDVTAGLTDSLDRYGRGGMVAPFRLIDGTEALPAFAFNAETGSGLYRESTGVVAMSVLGTARQEWTAAGIVFLSPVAFAGNATINGDLEVTGDVLADGNLGTLGNFGVTGSSAFIGPATFNGATFNGTLHAVGAVTFDSTLAVGGATSLHDTGVTGVLTVTGAASVGGNLSVFGAISQGGQPLNNLYLSLAGGVMSGNIDMRSPYPGAGNTPASHFYGFSAVQSFGSVVAQAGMGVAYTRVSGDTDYGSDLYFTTSFDNAPSERMRIDRQGWVGIGTVPVAPGLTVRSETAGGLLRLTNKSVSGSTHMFGAVLFDAFRDVSDPSHVAAVWAEGTSPAGNTADLMFGVQQNGGSALPAQRMRIDMLGRVGIGTTTGTGIGGFLEVVGGGITTLLRQTNPASYTSLRLYNDQNNPFRALEIDYTGSTYAGGEGANINTTGAFPLALGTNNSPVLTIPGATPYWLYDNVRAQRLGWANLPQSSPGDWNVGMVTYINANVSIIGGGAAVGTTYIIFNTTAGNLTFNEVGGLNLWLGGSNTHGNRTLAPHCLATLWYWAPNDAVLCGQGVS
jgi:hypothetical protein